MRKDFVALSPAKQAVHEHDRVVEQVCSSAAAAGMAHRLSASTSVSSRHKNRRAFFMFFPLSHR